jgi:hypothetical protein
MMFAANLQSAICNLKSSEAWPATSRENLLA